MFFTFGCLFDRVGGHPHNDFTAIYTTVVRCGIFSRSLEQSKQVLKKWVRDDAMLRFNLLLGALLDYRQYFNEPKPPAMWLGMETTLLRGINKDINYIVKINKNTLERVASS